MEIVKKAKIGDILILENGDRYQLQMIDDDEFRTVCVKTDETVTHGYYLSKDDLSDFATGELVYGFGIDEYKIVDIVTQ